MPDTPAPPRLVPRFDNLVLSHADRSRILGDIPPSRIVTNNGLVHATILVDGMVAGTWQLEQGRVVLEPFGKLDAGVKRALERGSDAAGGLRRLERRGEDDVPIGGAAGRVAGGEHDSPRAPARKTTGQVSHSDFGEPEEIAARDRPVVTTGAGRQHRFAPDTRHPKHEGGFMFRITAITRVGLIAVVCVAVAAPPALAKSPAKGGKAKVVKVQSVKKAASSSNDNVVLRAGLSTAYAQGCQNGTLPDRTMGGDNNNYEYYGDVLHRLGADQPLPGSCVQQVTRRRPPRPPAPRSPMTTPNYGYYGSAGG